MLMLSFTALIIALCVETSHGLLGYSSNGNDRMPMCATPSKPCRLKINVSSYTNNFATWSDVETCTCSPPLQCPNDWNTQSHVISRQLISTTQNITMEMMFCNRVEPVRFCNRGRSALVVKGYSMIPQEIESYNCRCRRSQPLLLQEMRLDEDHMTRSTYVCAYHMRRCARRDNCSTADRIGNTVHCRCPGSRRCHVAGDTVDGQYQGFCRQQNLI